jgi:hypothetical protein
LFSIDEVKRAAVKIVAAGAGVAIMGVAALVLPTASVLLHFAVGYGATQTIRQSLSPVGSSATGMLPQGGARSAEHRIVRSVDQRAAFACSTTTIDSMAIAAFGAIGLFVFIASLLPPGCG